MLLLGQFLGLPFLFHSRIIWTPLLPIRDEVVATQLLPVGVLVSSAQHVQARRKFLRRKCTTTHTIATMMMGFEHTGPTI